MISFSNTALDYYSKRCYNSIGDNNEKENTCRPAYRRYLFGLRPCDKYNPKGGERFSCACDGSKYELPGTEKTRYCNGKSESLSAEESFEDLLSSVPSFNVKADVDKDGNVTLKTPMSVEVTGDRLGDVLYTVYSYDGKVLAKESKKLELPKEDIDGCLVKIKITWGKKDTSYLEEDYWFAAMYNTER